MENKEKPKKSLSEVAKNYEKVIKSIKNKFEFSDQFLELKKAHEHEVKELNKAFNKEKDAIFNEIVKQECLKFGVNEKNIRKIAGY